MTNEQIITAYKVRNNIPVDRPLWTYAGWMAQGWRPRKGEAPRHRVMMIGKARGRTTRKEFSLFEQDQCERIV